MPGLEGQGRSEGIVLKKTVAYMREQLVERRELIRRIEENGGQVGDGLKKILLHQQSNGGSSRSND